VIDMRSTTQHTNTVVSHSRDGGTPAGSFSSRSTRRGLNSEHAAFGTMWERHNAPQMADDCWLNSRAARWVMYFAVAVVVAFFAKHVAGTALANAAFDAVNFRADWRG
jgi:hypothetical protein